MKKQRMEVKTCLCTECRQSMFVPRSKGFRREVGHVKYMYCPKCREVKAFIELDSFERIPDGFETVIADMENCFGS